MARFIPMFPEFHDQSFGGELAGSAVRFRYRWNERTAAWYLDIATPSDAPVVTGRALRRGRPPLEGIRAREALGDKEVGLALGGAVGEQLDPPVLALYVRTARAVPPAGFTVRKVTE